jgi:hypothetical protein
MRFEELTGSNWLPLNGQKDIYRQISTKLSRLYRIRLPSSQIVPILLDKGQYIASEASFYRVLKAVGQLNRRGRQGSRKKHRNQLA